MGCTTITGSSGPRYRLVLVFALSFLYVALVRDRWAMQNPSLVAPVFLDYEIHEQACCRDLQGEH